MPLKIRLNRFACIISYTWPLRNQSIGAHTRVWSWDECHRNVATELWAVLERFKVIATFVLFLSFSSRRRRCRVQWMPLWSQRKRLMNVNMWTHIRLSHQQMNLWRERASTQRKRRRWTFNWNSDKTFTANCSSISRDFYLTTTLERWETKEHRKFLLYGSMVSLAEKEELRTQFITRVIDCFLLISHSAPRNRAQQVSLVWTNQELLSAAIVPGINHVNVCAYDAIA
jgi:hypothetical protein